jgi:acetyl esterase/lipase
MTTMYNLHSTIAEVMADPLFGDYGRLLFPVDLHIDPQMTLEEVTSSSVYLWYSDLQPAMTVEVINALHAWREEGRTIFYPIYTEEEQQRDPSLKNTGLFFFPGKPQERFAIMNAGGGFYYVGAMHDSFPHALTLSRQGYNAFALIYRTDSPFGDLARAITFVEDRAEDLQVNPYGYSLWGGSASARMAASLGNRKILSYLTGRKVIPWQRKGEGLPQAASVIMQYTGYTEASRTDAPTYACVGTADGIAWYKTMEHRLKLLDAMGIPNEFHVYRGLSHGFGLGTGTAAEGWINDAIAFWNRNSEADL